MAKVFAAADVNSGVLGQEVNTTKQDIRACC